MTLTVYLGSIPTTAPLDKALDRRSRWLPVKQLLPPMLEVLRSLTLKLKSVVADPSAAAGRQVTVHREGSCRAIS